MELYNRFYLDKEKDIIVNLYQEEKDELTYVLETPNHKTGNLITNLARICNVGTVKNEKGMKVITGKLPACINADNEEVYIFRLGGVKVANIYPSGRIEIKAKIPAINKTLMSQTKYYDLDVNKTIIKSYILKKDKFRTDLHTHIHANLYSDDLIALGIKHQIKYPLYYIKKLGLKLSDKQAKEIFIKRCEIERKYAYSDLTGKHLTRKIDDETCMNFADLILNNEEDMEENIAKIRNSLVLMKDGQAVFTNLEKLYLYRYVFSKGQISEEKIPIDLEKVQKIPERDVKRILIQMLEDEKTEEYKNNSLLQDKLLWVAREYQKQGIYYAQIAVTWIVRKGEEGAKILEELHEVLPKIEKETGVKLRFLAAISRTLMTNEQLAEAVQIIKVTSKSPYVVGSDIMGEEINDIRIFKPILKELIDYAIQEDDGFTIRIHAGENDSLRDNVERSIRCVEESVMPGKKTPRCRIGHGLYCAEINSEEGKRLIETMKKNGIVLEFQLTSNIRLNNLTNIENHPIKKYLEEGIKCVQGTDGCGFYGTDCMEEQMALTNLLHLKEKDLELMKQTENEIMQEDEKYFEIKSKKFEEWLKGRNIKQAILEEEEENLKNLKINRINLIEDNHIEAEDVLKSKIIPLPEDKIPIIIAGGSFNTKGRKTEIKKEEEDIIKELVSNIDGNKAYFVVGHKMEGYEKAIVDIAKKAKKKIEVDAIIPKKLSKEESKMLNKEVNGVRISTEAEELGIYKSFNYEIFERRNSIVVAFDGNSPVSNLVQEAKNGKGKAKIYVNEDVETLKEKAKSLEGYVTTFNTKESIASKIFSDHPELKNKE